MVRGRMVLAAAVAWMSVAAGAQGLPLVEAQPLPPDAQVTAAPPPDAQVTAAPPPDAMPDEPEPTVEQRFEAWLAAYRTQAALRGLDPVALDLTLGGLKLSPRVIELDRRQPDDANTTTRNLFSIYLPQRLNGARIAQGRRLANDLAATWVGIESRFGVPRSTVLAIWGMESSYGAVTGGFDLPRAIATLAFEGRRAELFTRELDAVVRIAGSGVVPRERLRGSWAGATGQPQFLPSSYLAYAVDGDGDGRADIWGSQADVAASIANYLARNGWVAGQGWGMPVIVPAALDRGSVRDIVVPRMCPGVLRRHSRWLPIAEWRRLGLMPAGDATWPADTQLATLVEPDGPGQGGYLTYGNYRAILEYNCSNFYALSVGLLADAIARPEPQPAPPEPAPPAGDAGQPDGLRF